MVLLLVLYQRPQLIFDDFCFIKLNGRYLYRMSNPASAIAPYNAAKVNLGIVRKALRVGKNIEHFKAAAIALQSPLAKVIKTPKKFY